jgi:hypothetical protein
MSKYDSSKLLSTLKDRFDCNNNRHKNIRWVEVEEKLKKNPGKLEALDLMESTGGEPDVVGFDKDTGEFIFVDCSPESPKERRSLCYDQEAWDSRKEAKPKNSAVEVAKEMGVKLLNEEEYFNLQKLGSFDTKTSSWILTPPEVRDMGGALFADRRFGRVFVYHNGAESYYAARGFRGILRV